MRANGIRTAPLLITILTAMVGCQRDVPAPDAGASGARQAAVSPRDALIARAKSLELDTPYVPPPGDPLEHHTAGFAKIMCSAVFITGLDPDFAAENVGYFTSPYAKRAKVGKPVIDRAAKAVHVGLPNGVTLTAKYLGSQGCVTLPVGKSSVNFTPVEVKSRLPDASIQPWPMGDVLPKAPLQPALDAAKVKQALDAAFEPAAEMTANVSRSPGTFIGDSADRAVTSGRPLPFHPPAARRVRDAQDTVHHGAGTLHAEMRWLTSSSSTSRSSTWSRPGSLSPSSTR